MRGLVESHEDTWEERLPFALGAIRMTEMKCLGGRSPYEVVYGMKPRPPMTMHAALPQVSDVSVDEYVKTLVKQMSETYTDILKAARDQAEKDEELQKGSPSRQLKVGDYVMIRDHEPKGRSRFEQKTSGTIYRISQALGQETFRLETLTEPGVPITEFINKINGDRLICVEVPSEDFAYTSNKNRQIEIWDDELGDWRRGEILKFSVDGAIFMRYDHQRQNPQWLTLSKLRYRWYTPTAAERRPTSGGSRKKITRKTTPEKPADPGAEPPSGSTGFEEPVVREPGDQES